MKKIALLSLITGILSIELTILLAHQIHSPSNIIPEAFAAAPTSTPTPTPIPYYFGNDPLTGDFVIGQRGGAVKIRVDSTGALIAPLKYTPNGQNLALNGSFEGNVRNDNVNPDNWTLNYQTACAACAYALSGSTTYVTGGGRVLSITTTNNTQVASIGSFPFPVIPGKTYTLQVDTAGNFAGLTTKIIYFPASGGTNYSDSDQNDTATILNGQSTTGTMTTYPQNISSAEFTPPATCGGSNNLPCTRAAVVVVQTGIAGTNTRYVDNVQVLIKGTSGTIPASNISSGQFGSGTGGGIYSFSGNVGIGTTVPGYALDLGSGIVNATNFYQSGSPFVSSQWTTSGSDIYRNTGNVGIGTTVPTAKLSIGGTTSTISNNSGNINIVPSGNLFVSAGNMGVGTTSPQAKLDIGGSGTYNLANSAGNLVIQPASDMVISQGNIGVGTTGPARKLEVVHNSDAYNGINVRNTNNGSSARAAFVATNGSSYAAFGTMGTGAGAYGFIDSGNGIYINGNVGIGTTVPAKKLDINVGSDTDAVVMHGTSTTSFGFIKPVHNGGTNPYLTLGWWTGSTYGNTTVEGGNVGIGTSIPSGKLDVAGQFGSSIFNAGNSGTSKSLDWNNGNTQYLTLTANVGTLTLSNPVSGRKYTLILKQDGSGNRTVTWPSTMRWSGGSAPTLTTTANKTDYVGFVYNSIDSKYDGVAIVKNF